MKSRRIAAGIKFPGGFLLIMSFIIGSISDVWSQTPSFDTTRIYHAMAKARRGEPITVAAIGGSITNGYAASTEDKRWVNLVASWWQTNFPSSTVTLVNAGIGATGSDIGTFRIKKDVIEKDPDFVVVEFAVNDAGLNSDYVKKMMEGIVRQLLGDTSKTGVMLLLLKMEDGGTAQADHKVVGDYYEVPWVSQVDLIGPALLADGLTLRDVYFDNPGVHPNDLGMQYIADFITEVLDSILTHLPADEALSEVNMTLPEPLMTDIYATTYTFTPTTLIPDINIGWETGLYQWTSDIPGSELAFTLDGNAVAIQYTKVFSTERGRIEAWVDDGPHKVIDAFFTETWGTKPCFELVAEDLPDGDHTLHIKILSEHDPQSNGYFFPLMSVYKAGNITSAPPIAVPGTPVKTLTGVAVTLDGSSSNDPDGDTLTAYKWSVEESPVGSAADISDDTLAVSSFTPDEAGYYKIGLVVTGGGQQSVIQHLLIHAVATNAIPVAVAGADTTVATSKKVQLDGSGSYDDDNDTLTFEWVMVLKPAGSNASIRKSRAPDAYFIPDAEGEYQITLTVNDSLANSVADTIFITAIEGYSALQGVVTNENNLQIYPSPSHGYITIRYRLEHRMPVTIRLFSPEGRLLCQPVSTIQEQGSHELSLDIKSFSSSGNMLFVQLETERSVIRQKVVVF